MVRIHNDTPDTSNYTDWKSNCRNHTQESCVASEAYVVHGCPTAIAQASKLVNEIGDVTLVAISGTTTDTAKYTGPRTFTDKKTIGPVKPVSFMVLLSEEDFSMLLPFSLFRPVKLQ